MKQPRKVMKQQNLYRTLSPCPECKKVLEAFFIQEDNTLFMKKTCPEHGTFSSVFSKYAEFYKRVYSLKDTISEKRYKDYLYLKNDRHLPYVHEVYIDLTENCNLTCPQCFAAANTEKKPLIEKERVFEYIPRLKKYKTIVSFCGGEPTLHDELPEIISRFVQEGFTVRLLTNGIKLTDEKLIKELKQAGLKWVILQFDGFKDNTYKVFRSRPLLDLKLEVLRKLTENKFFILLAVMIARGVNLNEVKDIINFAKTTPYIVQVGFLPCANQGRFLLNDFTLEPPELMEEIARGTNNTVIPNDFIATLRIGRFLSRITKNYSYKPRTCQFGVYLYHDDKVAFPLHRLFNPFLFFKNFHRFPRILGAIYHALNWKKSPYHPNLLGITIERFRDADTIDLTDATNCTKAYITDIGSIPNCIYNSIHRDKTSLVSKNIP